MASNPIMLVLLCLAWFTTDVHSEKILNVLKGSPVVLSPDVVETKITDIIWKHGNDLAAEWFGASVTLYRSFKDRCSLNTKTGELKINDVRLEDGGVFTPEINGKTQTAVKLQVFSPVPKPIIALSCNSEITKCSLSCMFNKTDDLGNVEIFWIVDDRRVKEGTEIHITKEMNDETFICRLNNSFSSENSAELQNPFLAEKRRIIIVGLLVVIVVLVVPLVILSYLHTKLYLIRRRFTKRCKSADEDGDLSLQEVDQMILSFFKERNEISLSEESNLMLLTVRSRILSVLEEKKDVKERVQHVRSRILSIFDEKKDVKGRLWNVNEMILRFFRGRNERKSYEESDQMLMKVYLIISRFIKKGKSADEEELVALNGGDAALLNELKLILEKPRLE